MRRSGDESECLRQSWYWHRFTRSSRAIKMNLANEGLEARKKEEEVNAKKRKAEEDAQWEGTTTLLSL